MTAQEIDRIECAIRHIQTANDVDPWAAEIAVRAMRKQIPKKPNSALQEQELKQEVKNSKESSLTQKGLDTISRQAVAYLDLFTKIYCRDYSVTDDLVFRCKECRFEKSDGKCLVKCMARMLCPDFKNFGCMGDL